MSGNEFEDRKSIGNQMSGDPDFDDLEFSCIDCDEAFIWTSGEQLFFRDKGLANSPKRCRPCKKKKNARIESVRKPKAKNDRERIEVNVDCANCDQNTTVPFYPTQGRPVYCRSCFLLINPETISSPES